MVNTRLWRSFGGDKPPFFLAIFFAALAWSVTRYADSLAMTPVIEYDVVSSTKEVSVELENLTKDKTFSGLVFVIRTVNGKVRQAKITPTEPAWEGENKAEYEGQSATYSLPDFQPGWKYRLSATVDDGSVPIFQLVRANKTVRLLAPCLETWIIRHQSGLLLGLLLVWASITTVMLLKGVEDEATASETVGADGDNTGTSVPTLPSSSRPIGD